ncbi:MAG: hypothetical protein AB1649_27625 [Chloroflexota bacterium]
MSSNLVKNQQVYACSDADCTTQSDSVSPTPRDLFTEQTGQALIALGKLFVNVPPFNDHIDRSTGDMLISIGKKLKRK